MTNPTTNALTFADLEKFAQEFGEQCGKGKDTQIKFLLKVAEGAYLGALDTTQNKHGAGVDDAEKLASVYYKAQTGATVFDATANNQRKLMSCVRTGIRIGGWTKGGAGEPIATINELLNHRQQLRRDPGMAKKLDDAANTFLRYARTQLKRDTLIEGAELKELVYRPVSDPAGPEAVLKNIAKSLDNLIKGKASNGHAQDSAPALVQAHQLLKKRLDEIASGRVRNTLKVA